MQWKQWWKINIEVVVRAAYLLKKNVNGIMIVDAFKSFFI
jgi:hypothetical protein